MIRNSDLFEQIKEGKQININLFDLLSERSIGGEYLLSSSNVDTEDLNEGDIIVCNMGGGGGYGDVLDRDPNAVLKDLEDDVITPDVAEKIYRVVIDPVTGVVDQKKTEKMRARLRRERIRKGKSFATFIEEWKKLKPPKEILEYYGHWPEPRLETYERDFWGLYH